MFTVGRCTWRGHSTSTASPTTIGKVIQVSVPGSPMSETGIPSSVYHS